MTLEEILTREGLEEAQIQQIMQSMKAQKLYLTGEENLDLRYKKLKGEVERLQSMEQQLQKAKEALAQEQAQTQRLRQDAEKQRLHHAVYASLIAGGAEDCDYLCYKLEQQGGLELEESGQIRDWDARLTALKQQFPTQFQGKRRVQEQRLPKKAAAPTLSPQEFDAMGYQQRLRLHAQQPKTYARLTGRDDTI